MYIIERHVGRLVQRGYVTKTQAPWLQYALEKRITTLAVTVPLIIIGVLVSSLEITLALVISFYALRHRTNGFHAKTFFGCLILSILWELIFLFLALLRLFTIPIVIILLLVSTAVIFLIAPYNSPSIHLFDSEIAACKIGTRIRLIILLSLITLMYIIDQEQIAKGIVLGIIMTALSLVLANIQSEKGGNSNESEGRRTFKENHNKNG